MTDGVRRLTHEEAEMLISARMDEQLDRADSRALLVHLQTCESCRAFAVQSEVLGRELAALPVLPPSAVVDRQIRESIAKGNRRWSLASLLPGPASNRGLRVAAAALAVLTLVSVFLLVRIAGDNSDDGTSIDAPSGGIAQQIELTPSAELAMAQNPTVAGPTETPRVLIPPTKEPESSRTPAPTQKAAPTQTPRSTNDTSAQVEPTKTLDSSYVYPIDKTTRTPAAGSTSATQTPQAPIPTATQEEGQVAVAAVLATEGTPEAPVEAVSPEATGSSVPSGETLQETATATAEATVEDTATATPTEPAPEPTMTPTPIEISVGATEQPQEPGTQPPVDELQGDINTQVPTGTPDTSSQVSEQPLPDLSPTAQPAENAPTEGPFTQPTIAPMNGQTSGDQGSDQSSTSPPIVPNGGSDVQPASTGETTGSDSPAIVPAGGTSVPDGIGSAGSSGTVSQGGQGGDTSQGGPAPIPTVDESIQPSGLDLSDTVAELPSGTSSPLGRLEFSPGADLYAVLAPDGQLAVANLDGDIVTTLGTGHLPVWSGNYLMYSAPGDNGTVVGIWNADSGDVNLIPASADEPSSDVPIGGDGTTFYFLRTFPDRPGAMEIRNASADGSDEGALWTSDSTNLGGARPVWSSGGILLPTDSKWMLIDSQGNASELGDNPYGYVGVPILSPGEGLIAYSAGDQVYVAWADDPGTAVATAAYTSGSGGYAFATSGEQLVVSDGQSLHVVSYEGEDLGSLSGNQPIGGVYWISDTIYYLQIGQDAALKSTNLAAIQGD